jgi:Na+/melibiose symporter-like transporter
MLTNLLGPALSWTIFFSQTPAQKIAGINPNALSENYIRMGAGFSLVSLIFVLFCCISTYKYRQSDLPSAHGQNGIGDFFRTMKNILQNRLAIIVYAYVVVAIAGIAVVSVLQMYCYIHFLQASGPMKTIVHGGSMIAMGLGGLCTQYFVTRLGKRGTAVIAVVWNVCCNLVLVVLFLPKFVNPGDTLNLFGYNLPIGFVAFSIFHDSFWFANGLFLTVSASMVADASFSLP